MFIPRISESVQNPKNTVKKSLKWHCCRVGQQKCPWSWQSNQQSTFSRTIRCEMFWWQNTEKCIGHNIGKTQSRMLYWQNVEQNIGQNIWKTLFQCTEQYIGQKILKWDLNLRVCFNRFITLIIVKSFYKNVLVR